MRTNYTLNPALVSDEVKNRRNLGEYYWDIGFSVLESTVTNKKKSSKAGVLIVGNSRIKVSPSDMKNIITEMESYLAAYQNPESKTQTFPVRILYKDYDFTVPEIRKIIEVLENSLYALDIRSKLGTW